ncbi:T9SS type A sorting domain-containing protein [uncultured Winogradskyella sp.]|uniref:T9SS type A sorting domain-containing protein n=1 Tax=uncultured Winogradskyella sp. TaxID=395353 RepID=UPI00260FDE2E|nr:T9SS type A sorting domain-containing protein [uncultured Winogradskyella sp.]
MKKITLLFTLLTFAVNAQTFPNPYCEIPSGAVVEEISSVNFDLTSITNSDTSSILVDKTTSIVNIIPNQTYTISVTGNTYGNFDTNIVAFIDWNQNETLDDANEVYSIGTLTNTTGDDGTIVSLDITIPSDAVIGATRIRITKTYTDADSPAIVDPCSISFNPFGTAAQPGYGQALDFTLSVSSLSVNSFDISQLSVYPNPIKNTLNVSYNAEIKSVKIYNLLGQNILTHLPNASQFQVDVSSLNAGVYIVKLFSENDQYSFRTLKK